MTGQIYCLLELPPIESPAPIYGVQLAATFSVQLATFVHLTTTDMSNQLKGKEVWYISNWIDIM